MKQPDATMIYWIIRSAQHVSGNILPIIRSVRLRFLQHMISCCCGGQGDVKQQRATLPLTVSVLATTTGYHML